MEIDNLKEVKEEILSDFPKVYPSKRNSNKLTKSLPALNRSNYEEIENLNKNIQNNINTIYSKNKKEKHLLVVRKININEKKNNFYKKGVNEIFNDENIFLNKNYEDKLVIIGRNNSRLFKKKNINNSHSVKNINNFGKQRMYKSSTDKINLYSKKDNFNDSGADISKNLIKKKYVDKNIINAYDFQNNKNNFSINNNSIISKYENLKKSFNIYGKRAPIYFSGNNYITDGELKIIYQNCLERVKKNNIKELLKIKLNNEKKNIDNKDIKNKNLLYKKIFKTTIDKEMNSRLNLQQKILSKFQDENNESQKLKNKIIKITSKDNEKLLINQLDNYRIKMEKIEENERINKPYIYNKTIQWLSSLRNYSKDQIKIDNEDSIKKINNSTIPIFNKNIRSMINIKYTKDNIYDNYLNNLQYSFGNNNNKFYYDIESNISPLYSLILSENHKNNEKVRNSHIDNILNTNKNIKNSSNNDYRILKKNFSTPLLNKKKYSNNFNDDLKIEGKRLLDFEIEMSKNLQGKRKKLVKTIYNEEEVEPKIFAKSYLLNNFYFPKGIKNTFQIH